MKKPGKKTLLCCAIVLVLIPVSGGIYSLVARRTLEKEIADTPRDPVTGIILGTEPITLEGSGEKACLLIHGWLGSRIDFRDLGNRLQEKGLTVRMMLLPGHGTDPLDLARQGVGDFLEAARAELLALKKSGASVVLVGFSMGGALSTILAAEEEVDKLVLIAPFYEITYKPYYLLPPDCWNSIMKPFIPYVIKGKGFVRVNREAAKGRIFSYQVVPTEAVAVLCELGRRARDPEVLEEISCPVLLLHGTGDEAADPDAALEALSHLSGPKQEPVLFHRSNHHLLWDYDGEEAAVAIIDFITGDTK